MFTCKECGRLFEEPISWVEKHNLDGPPYEVLYGCPFCDGAFDEAEKCDCCEDYIEGEHVMTDDGKLYCKDCYVIVR